MSFLKFPEEKNKINNNSSMETDDKTVILGTFFDDMMLQRMIKIEKIKIKVSCGNYYIPEGQVARKMLEYFGFFPFSR